MKWFQGLSYFLEFIHNKKPTVLYIFCTLSCELLIFY